MRAQQPSVLITGVTGHLGASLVNAWAGKRNIIGIKRSSSNAHRVVKHIGSIPLIDIDEVSLTDVFKHYAIDTVIHTAGRYADERSLWHEVWESNVLFSLRLLEAARAHHVKTFIHCDTCLPKELNAYSLSKKHFVEAAHAYDRGPMRFVNMIFQHFYGPNDGRFLSTIHHELARGAKTIPLTKGEQHRDFIFIDDVVRAFDCVLDRRSDFRSAWTDLEIGSGESYPLSEIVRRMQELSGQRNTELQFGARPYREGEPMHLVADITAMKALGWSPQVSLNDGLRAFWE